MKIHQNMPEEAKMEVATHICGQRVWPPRSGRHRVELDGPVPQPIFRRSIPQPVSVQIEEDFTADGRRQGAGTRQRGEQGCAKVQKLAETVVVQFL